jgi:hypothetical protein
MRFLAGTAALALLLLSMQSAPALCDESCHDEAPTCECAGPCCFKVIFVATEPVMPDMTLVRHAVSFESASHAFRLATDIFRPPIA